MCRSSQIHGPSDSWWVSALWSGRQDPSLVVSGEFEATGPASKDLVPEAPGRVLGEHLELCLDPLGFEVFQGGRELGLTS